MGITPFIKKNNQRFVGAPRAFLARLVPTTGRRRTAARTDSRSGAPAFELKWIPLTHSMGLYIISIHLCKGNVPNCRRARHVRAPTRTENQLALFPNRLSAICRGATCLSGPSGADHRKAQDGLPERTAVVGRPLLNWSGYPLLIRRFYI